MSLAGTEPLSASRRLSLSGAVAVSLAMALPLPLALLRLDMSGAPLGVCLCALPLLGLARANLGDALCVRHL